jgi:hypothetical protein
MIKRLDARAAKMDRVSIVFVLGLLILIAVIGLSLRFVVYLIVPFLFSLDYWHVVTTVVGLSVANLIWVLTPHFAKRVSGSHLTERVCGYPHIQQQVSYSFRWNHSSVHSGYEIAPNGKRVDSIDMQVKPSFRARELRRYISTCMQFVSIYYGDDGEKIANIERRTILMKPTRSSEETCVTTIENEFFSFFYESGINTLLMMDSPDLRKAASLRPCTGTAGSFNAKLPKYIRLIADEYQSGRRVVNIKTIKTTML